MGKRYFFFQIIGELQRVEGFADVDFSPITWLNLRRSSRKVTKGIGKLGSGISKMWIIFAPGDRSRDTARAQ